MRAFTPLIIRRVQGFPLACVLLAVFELKHYNVALAHHDNQVYTRRNT